MNPVRALAVRDLPVLVATEGDCGCEVRQIRNALAAQVRQIGNSYGNLSQQPVLALHKAVEGFLIILGDFF